jgi:hypothetical protein
MPLKTQSKTPIPLRYPFSNYCPDCKSKNNEFLIYNPHFQVVERKDGIKMLINT